MKTVFDLAVPRAQVLQGELRPELFAARLKDVMDRTADPVYRDPDPFFENTYPTAGLRTLLREALGRLTGQSPTNSPIIRLETSFGGGKTHNLIALYHAVGGKCPPARLHAFAGDDVPLPQPGDVDVAGVVGSDLDPSVGIYHKRDDVTTYTLWGELAYQLGGRAGYALAQENDLDRRGPGTALFERIVGERPTLIMIDEIARHLRAGVATPTATGQSNLADQTVGFLMSLLEFAASQKQVVVVLTMASDVDAFRQETEALHQALAESLKVSARQERVLTPTDENEISAIVVHRLFERVDREGAQGTIARYGAYYRELEAQDVPVHERALRANYLDEFALAYPFHPELIRVLNLRVATIPNFQRTRGALRLLAAVVRQLWRNRPPRTWLIHPHHIDLAHQPIIEDLTSRLDRPKFKQVCEADIVSPQTGIPAHAAEADELLVASGKPPYARLTGMTIFMHNLTQGIVSGVELPELLLSVLTPDERGGDDPALVKRALERLYEKAWFLEYDGYKYRFKTEPSLNKIIDDEMDAVGTPRAKQEIDERIRKIWRTGYLKPGYFPDTPSDVDDDAGKPKLAIMHYDAVSVNAATTSPPDLVRRIYERAGTMESCRDDGVVQGRWSRAGTMESFRNYQNNVLFLVADADQVEQMVRVARRYLAIGRITGFAERMREFNEEYQKRLRKMGEAAELEVRVAITKAYRFLLYPTGDARRGDAYLRREIVPPQDQGDTDIDQTNVVVRVLYNLQKVRTADDNALPAQYLFARAWDLKQTDMTTEDLRRAFARKIGLPILLDVSQLQRSIENGVKNQIWLYYDAREEFAYDHESPPAFWQIGDHARLYTPEEAERLNLRIKGKWQSTETGGKDKGGGEEEEPPEDLLKHILGGGPPSTVTGTGVPAQAFQQVRDRWEEHGAVAIRRFQVRFEGIEKGRADDLAAIGLAIPQMGKAEFGIKVDLVVQFGNAPGEYLELGFQGNWDRYRQFRKVCEDFAREPESQINVKFELVIDFGRNVVLDDLRQVVDIRDVLTQMEMGPIEVRAELVYADPTVPEGKRL